MGSRKPLPERVFDLANALFFFIMALSTLLPFANLLAKSLSSEEAVLAGRVGIWPIGFQVGTYAYVLRQAQFQFSMRNSLIITISGTALSMALTCMVAYPLSKPWLFGRKRIMVAFVFVMLFNGGMIPTYLLIRGLGMLNTLWALFVPNALSVYNMLLLKNFFEELPESIEESARLDGARNLRILFSIILPISLPALATVGLFYAVGFWNNYMGGVLYITQPQLKPLQQFLYEIVTESQRAQDSAALGVLVQDPTAVNLQPDAVRAAAILLASVPIMAVYPFLQKYFVKGLVVGSVKG
jgi:putative aldouronate transport system permease protein